MVGEGSYRVLQAKLLRLRSLCDVSGTAIIVRCAWARPYHGAFTIPVTLLQYSSMVYGMVGPPGARPAFYHITLCYIISIYGPPSARPASSPYPAPSRMKCGRGEGPYRRSHHTAPCCVCTYTAQCCTYIYTHTYTAPCCIYIYYIIYIYIYIYIYYIIYIYIYIYIYAHIRHRAAPYRCSSIWQPW
jgi:hypothetical protein